MKELELVIKKRGFVYKQVFKNDTGYIYEQIFNGNVIAYESFLRKENKMFNCISYPGDNAFGLWAWTCKTFERAKSYING
jgi:hypothetical protein